jgi:protein-tyrosine phosphatase
LGNIIRSPLAEGMFRHFAQQAGVDHKYELDSAGTGSWHVGERPDSRMRRVAASHGLRYDGRSRQIRRQDLTNFDLIIAMDLENKSALQRLAHSPEGTGRIHLLREFDPYGGENAAVPDPYYGGIDGFEETYRIVERSCKALLEKLESGEFSLNKTDESS